MNYIQINICNKAIGDGGGGVEECVPFSLPFSLSLSLPFLSLWKPHINGDDITKLFAGPTPPLYNYKDIIMYTPAVVPSTCSNHPYNPDIFQVIYTRNIVLPHPTSPDLPLLMPDHVVHVLFLEANTLSYFYREEGRPSPSPQCQFEHLSAFIITPAERSPQSWGSRYDCFNPSLRHELVLHLLSNDITVLPRPILHIGLQAETKNGSLLIIPDLARSKSLVSQTYIITLWRLNTMHFEISYPLDIF